jgi:hypothetical protein
MNNGPKTQKNLLWRVVFHREYSSTSVAEVPGGWIYLHRDVASETDSCQSMVFVPFPEKVKREKLVEK